MQDPTPFYDGLATDYRATIRTLVERYDDFVEAVLEPVAAAEPARIVDVGCGVGEVSAALLERLPRARLTALDLSAGMVRAAEERLAPFGSRARVLQRDARAFQVEDGCEAVVSTLVLHNLPAPERARVLSAILGWLRPGCPFVWGDFVHLDDPRLAEQLVARRRRVALARGCDPEVVEANFRKEAEHDAPTTVAGMAAEARAVGFDPVDVLWVDGAFAVLHLRAPAF